MAWTTPKTYTAEKATSADMNTYVRDNMLFLYNAIVNRAILRDEKTSGTEGGAAAATTWNACDLNTEVTDPGNIVTVSANKFRPVQGTHMVKGTKAVWDDVTNLSRVRLYNVTAAAVVDEAPNSDANGGKPVPFEFKFTANGTDEYRIDVYTTAAQATFGLGRAMSLGVPEVYMELELWQIG